MDAKQRQAIQARLDAITPGVWTDEFMDSAPADIDALGKAVDERDARIDELETALGELWESFDTTNISVPPRTMSALIALREVYDND